MDVIVSIQRERGRFRLTLSGGETIDVPAELFRERPFQEGDSVDLEAYDQWLLTRQYRPALEYAVSLLAARAHSAREIERKLLGRHYRPATAEMVLYKLRREGLLDDADFARQWTASRASRKLGPARIARELRQKGVADADAEAALMDIDKETQLADATALAEKAFRHGKPGEDPRKAAQRVAGMLARRGYAWDIAREAIRQAQSNMDEK